jgi:hypothetical protein
MKAKFEESRKTKMSDEEFKILVLTYPVYLVAKADGNFDEDEKDLLSTILYNFLNSLYGENVSEEGYENLISNYLEDFNYLTENESIYKNDFLQELKSFELTVKKSIHDLLNEIAGISGGIDTRESEMIAYISDNYLS